MCFTLSVKLLMDRCLLQHRSVKDIVRIAVVPATLMPSQRFLKSHRRLKNGTEILSLHSWGCHIAAAAEVRTAVKEKVIHNHSVFCNGRTAQKIFSKYFINKLHTTLFSGDPTPCIGQLLTNCSTVCQSDSRELFWAVNWSTDGLFFEIQASTELS